MNAYTADFVSEPTRPSMPPASPVGARRQRRPQDALILSELDPMAVVDHLDDDATPLHLTTFGTVREICPKCQRTQLRLVLRQACVRNAHLFCEECASCFDAHYPDGKSALSI